MQQINTSSPEPAHADSDAEYDAWFRREVQIGIDQANAGLLIPNEKVKAYFAALRKATLHQIELENAS